MWIYSNVSTEEKKYYHMTRVAWTMTKIIDTKLFEHYSFDKEDAVMLSTSFGTVWHQLLGVSVHSKKCSRWTCDCWIAMHSFSIKPTSMLLVFARHYSCDAALEGNTFQHTLVLGWQIHMAREQYLAPQTPSTIKGNIWSSNVNMTFQSHTCSDVYEITPSIYHHAVMYNQIGDNQNDRRKTSQLN